MSSLAPYAGGIRVAGRCILKTKELLKEVDDGERYVGTRSIEHGRLLVRGPAPLQYEQEQYQPPFPMGRGRGNPRGQAGALLGKAGR